jgi:hypothetical protein
MDKHEVTAHGRVGQENGAVQKIEAPVVVSAEDLHGFKMSRSIGRSHGHCLEHSWVLGLALISMKVVNKNGEGG